MENAIRPTAIGKKSWLFFGDAEAGQRSSIIYMNDNGQTHGLDVFNAGMRGSKCTIWQGGSRAMLFWKWAGKWQPHEVQNLSAHLDVLPTLCDFAGVKLPADLGAKLEGFTLRPRLESTQPLSWHDDRLLFHHIGRWPSGMAAAHKYAMASVKTGDYLLVRSRPYDEPACEQYSSQCTALVVGCAWLHISKGYNEENAVAAPILCDPHFIGCSTEPSACPIARPFRRVADRPRSMNGLAEVRTRRGRTLRRMSFLCRDYVPFFKTDMAF